MGRGIPHPPTKESPQGPPASQAKQCFSTETRSPLSTFEAGRDRGEGRGAGGPDPTPTQNSGPKKGGGGRWAWRKWLFRWAVRDGWGGGKERFVILDLIQDDS